MKQQKESFYSDEYISRFYKLLFPKFSYDLIVQTLSYLTIPKILLIQSLVNDEYIKRIKINQITKRRLYIEHFSCSGFTPEEFRISERKRRKIFQDILTLIKSYPDNIVPIYFNFFNKFPIGSINELLRKLENYDIALEFDELNYPQCKKLEGYKGSSNVTRISIDTVTLVDRRFPTYVDLNFSNYANLKTFEVQEFINVRSLRLDGSFESLTFLSIRDIFHEDYLAKFINLKTLCLEFQKNLNIRKLPRNIISLYLIPLYEISEIFIDSTSDWPQNLRSLSFTISDSAFNAVRHKLPPYLVKLEINYLTKIENSLPQFCYYLSELFLNFDDDGSNLIDYIADEYFDDVDEEDEESEEESDEYEEYYSAHDEGSHGYICVEEVFSNQLQTIDVRSLGLICQSENQIHVSYKLEKLKLYVTECLFSMDRISFERAKLSLKTLSISINDYKFSLSNLDFSQFSKLSLIYLSGCNIDNLNSFFLPPYLKLLIIKKNHFKSIDSTSPLFNKSYRYPHLQVLLLKSCDVDYISPRINLPTNLKKLSLPHYGTKQVLRHIIKHKTLTSFNLEKCLSNLNIFDEFVPKRRTGKEKTTHFNQLNLHLKMNYSKIELTKFYDKIEAVFGKRIKTREYNYYTCLYLTLV
ncbi:hypothetical protein DFJ63DRAFT_125689 [Scheffersomyces coipomensis]|uniref:uncharacterized protein n=1 Tax=Scheffersomyces coipomensis TaxID=1788519 RepID=UPI00315DC57C